MIYLLMFLGIALSIIKANCWIVVPSFCIFFCWITSFASWMLWSYSRGIGQELAKQIRQKEAAKEGSK